MKTLEFFTVSTIPHTNQHEICQKGKWKTQLQRFFLALHLSISFHCECLIRTMLTMDILHLKCLWISLDPGTEYVDWIDEMSLSVRSPKITFDFFSNKREDRIVKNYLRALKTVNGRMLNALSCSFCDLTFDFGFDFGESHPSGRHLLNRTHTHTHFGCNSINRFSSQYGYVCTNSNNKHYLIFGIYAKNGILTGCHWSECIDDNPQMVEKNQQRAHAYTLFDWIHSSIHVAAEYIDRISDSTC